MTQTEPLTKLTQLAGLIDESNDRFIPDQLSYQDDVSHLDQNSRFYWARILRSILSAELLEDFLLDPLISALPASTELEREIRRFLNAQGRDERKHQVFFRNYLTQTFQYERKGKTIANRIFVDGLLGNSLGYLKKNPCVGLALIFMYEDYSNHFYHHLKKQAQVAKLPALHALLTAVDKDEHRHTAGIKMILSLVRGTALEVKGRNEIFFRIFARLFSLDMNTEIWAVHNREVRRSLKGIGLDPKLISAGIGQSYARTLGLIRA